MRSLARLAAFCCLAAILTGLLAAAANPPATPRIAQRLHRAEEAYNRGEWSTAERILNQLQDDCDDPGLLACNRAAIHFAQGDYYQAELDYRLALQDADAPAERVARAWYNLGTALLHRGGSVDVYRSAIACFEHALGESLAGPLAADVRYNLELAKLRWAEARKKSSPSSKAISRAAEDDLPQRPPRERPGSSSSPAKNPSRDPPASPTNSPLGPNKSPGTQPPKSSPPPTDAQRLPGAGHLRPLLDTDQPQVLTAEETREYLRQAAERLQRDRRTLEQSLYGRDRPGVLDW